MTGRERVLAAIGHREADRIPISDAFWEDTLSRWRGEGLPPDAEPKDFFGFDIDFMYLDASPRQPAAILAQDADFITVRDRFGYVVRKCAGKSRTMEFLEHPTKDRAAWAALRKGFAITPGDEARVDTASYFLHVDPYPSWEEAKRRYERLRTTGRYLLLCAYGPWEATWRHRGYAELLMDTADDPDFVREMAETYADFLISLTDHCLGKGIAPDGLYMVEDLAATRGMLISPQAWRRLFKPFVRRLGEFLRARRISFWMHCCGNAEAVFDDLIECGVEVIQPLEAKSGLDVRVLKPRYGDRLTFFGNIDVIKMSGKESEIEDEIRCKLAAAKKGGGYIYHSDHSVPVEVSLDRYRRILDWVRKYGRYDA